LKVSLPPAQLFSATEAARGKAEGHKVSKKSETLRDDPLAIYKPTVTKHVDAAKTMATFAEPRP
jgi:hypothetical protein